jgi:glycerol uptake facilitator-like aquaporin
MTQAGRVVAEIVGTAFLLAAVVGSGIMGERLSARNVAIALLANTLATGAMLVALILTFGPISGAHFNPPVTLADASQRGVEWREVPAYIAAQVLGAFGVAAAHLMFGEPLFSASRHVRAGNAQVFSEFVATFGLVCVIGGCARLRALCSRRLHHWRVLVYCLNFIRQSCCDSCAFGEQHVSWHPACGCAVVYRVTAAGCGGCHPSVPLAGAFASERRSVRCGRAL